MCRLVVSQLVLCAIIVPVMRKVDWARELQRIQSKLTDEEASPGAATFAHPTPMANPLGNLQRTLGMKTWLTQRDDD